MSDKFCCPTCGSDLSPTVWFAKGGPHYRLGPFKNQIEAFEAVRDPLGGFYKDTFVWCEYKDDAKERDRPYEEIVLERIKKFDRLEREADHVNNEALRPVKAKRAA